MKWNLELILPMAIAWGLSCIIQLVKSRELRGDAKVSGLLTIIVFSLTILDNIIRLQRTSPLPLEIILLICRNSYFLIGPVLWLYSRSLLHPHRSIKYQDLLHLIPFIFGILWSIFLMKPGINLHVVRGVVSLITRFTYSLFTLIYLHRQKSMAQENYSRLTYNNTLSWIYNLLLFYTILFLIGSFNYLDLETPILVSLGITIRVIPSVIFIFFFTHFAPEQRALLDQEPESSEKYRTSGITDNKSKQLYNEFLEFMKSTKVYLDPDITLNQLAEKMGITRHHLSEVINREEHSNFYSLINSYRIDEFIEAVEGNLYPDYTILAIAMECGFKSSSAFYSNFKKVKGVTPAQFIKELAPSYR